jgi:aminotransferase
MSVACSDVGGINMAQGVCDTDPPHPVVEAAIEAIRSGQNIYTRLDGIAPLRDAIAQKFASFNGLSVDPNTQVLVTSGATGALNAALLALLNPGDECVVFEPFYGYHVSTLHSMRIAPVVVELTAPEFALDLDRLRAAITPRTRAIILNSPSNPSGKVFTQSELEALAEVAIEHDLFVFTDEMYECFIYDGARHISIATIPGMAERTITISGFSKTFSVTGWRILRRVNAGFRRSDTSTTLFTSVRLLRCNTERPLVYCNSHTASTRTWRRSIRGSAMRSARR